MLKQLPSRYIYHQMPQTNQDWPQYNLSAIGVWKIIHKPTLSMAKATWLIKGNYRVRMALDRVMYWSLRDYATGNWTVAQMMIWCNLCILCSLEFIPLWIFSSSLLLHCQPELLIFLQGEGGPLQESENRSLVSHATCMHKAAEGVALYNDEAQNQLTFPSGYKIFCGKVQQSFVIMTTDTASHWLVH